MNVGDEITVRCENPQCDCDLPKGKDLVGKIKKIGGSHGKQVWAKVNKKEIQLGVPGCKIWAAHNAQHPDYQLPAEGAVIRWQRVLKLQKKDQEADFDEPYMMRRKQITSRGITHEMNDVEFFGSYYDDKSNAVWARAYMDKEDEHGKYRVYGSGVHLGWLKRKDQIKPHKDWESHSFKYDNFNEKAKENCRAHLKELEWIPPPICEDCDREIPDDPPKQIKYCSCGQKMKEND